jgi:uncharacterized protein YndB with AHSA1/START domain
MAGSSSGTASPPAAAERELVITRVFDAPPERVFRAWTEREHLLRWCAPRGFTVTHAEGDVRPGGAWRSCMRSPEGVDYWLGGIYREVVRPERLVFTHAWDGEDGRPGPETLVTVDLAARGGGTEMTFRQSGFRSAESRDGHHEGWSETFDRLDRHVRELENQGERR